MSKASRDDVPLVSMKAVCKHYRDGDVQALRDVTLEVHSGEFVAVMGPSGCGKSTLLNMIGALDRPTSGDVSIEGRSLAQIDDLDHLRSRSIGFIFQSFYLLPNLTAEENVQIPMFESERKRSQRPAHARHLLSLVGLDQRFKHLPGQLSVGQRQRVAIARALANDPKLILADEPTGALDSQSGIEVMDLLGELNASQKTTLVVVTHDRSVADRGGRLIRMRDGQIVAT